MPERTAIIRPDAEPKPKFLRSSLLDPTFYAQHEGRDPGRLP